jgi:hypothetical protein
MSRLQTLVTRLACQSQVTAQSQESLQAHRKTAALKAGLPGVLAAELPEITMHVRVSDAPAPHSDYLVRELVRLAVFMHPLVR